MVGGFYSEYSVEVWTSQDTQCSLPPLPRRGMAGPSVDYVLGQVLACYDDRCRQLTPEGWAYLSSTVHYR